MLFDFLFKIHEQLVVKEFLNGDFKTVTNFLYSRNGGAVVASAYNVIKS